MSDTTAPETAPHDTLDSKDQRSHSDTVKQAMEDRKVEDAANEEEGPRPTEIAKSHGNKPSRGAVIDQRIEDEERAELERKGKA